jgi:hypothetical protein
VGTVATKAKMTKMLAAARGQYAVPHTNFRAHPFHSVRE